MKICKGERGLVRLGLVWFGLREGKEREGKEGKEGKGSEGSKGGGMKGKEGKKEGEREGIWRWREG